MPEAPTAAIAPDDLGRIKGLGTKLQALPPTLGVTSFARTHSITAAGNVSRSVMAPPTDRCAAP